MKKRHLIFEADSPSYHCRIIQSGIRQYFLKGEHSLSFLPLSFAELKGVERSLLTNKSLAIIGWLQNPTNIEYIKSHQFPFLNLFESKNMSNFGSQLTFEGEGRLAAEFFIEDMKYESLVFIGLDKSFSHRRRLHEFTEASQAHGISVHPLLLQSSIIGKGPETIFKFNSDMIMQRNRKLTRLLRDIPKPAGIFCADDRFALNVYYLAQHLGIHVPEEVSILGVGGIQKADEGGVQAISVIQLDHIHQGYQAAQLMEQSLYGENKPKTVVLSPDGIAHRSTTRRRSALLDPLVNKAFQIIEKDRSITANELAQKLNVSRRVLHNHFLTSTNMSAAKIIEMERFNRAKQLLRSTQYNHESIAGLAGYRNHQHMIRSFDRLVQMSPKQYSLAYINANQSSG